MIQIQARGGDVPHRPITLNSGTGEKKWINTNTYTKTF